MTRLQADLLLFLVSIIWGAAFVAQKDAMDHVGPFTFIASRFLLSALLVLPFALRERRKRATKLQSASGNDLLLLAASFLGGVSLQQMGVVRTTVTNAGFLTGLYVLFVPIICLFVYRQKISPAVIPAALLSVAGVWLLSGGAGAVSATLNAGDFMVLAGAACFALQVVLISRLMQKVKAPFQLAVFQYVVVAIGAGLIAVASESVTVVALSAAAFSILYAGAISGGFAYTSQIIAQQYAPPSDSAVILSAEALFAAVFGIWLLQERISLEGLIGCGLIILAILLVEFPQLLSKAIKTMKKI